VGKYNNLFTMPPLETIGFIPQVTPLLILLILSLVLNLKLFLPTVGQIFAVRKQSSYVLSNPISSSTQVKTSSLSTSIFCSPGSLGSDYESKVGSSLHSVLQDQFSKEVNTAYLEDTSLSEDSKKLQTLLSYKVQ
jgi:hypothetical protein